MHLKSEIDVNNSNSFRFDPSKLVPMSEFISKLSENVIFSYGRSQNDKHLLRNDKINDSIHDLANESKQFTRRITKSKELKEKKVVW